MAYILIHEAQASRAAGVRMLIVETPVFTRQVTSAMSDEQYRKLQMMLLMNPECGTVFQGGGGIRKVRFGAEGRGKRGGFRVIYYYAVDLKIIVMLFLYPKNEQDDLTPEQLRKLKAVVELEFGRAWKTARV